ncbi:MAG: hypothetical protein H7Y05_12740 [Steroidobacteraceae bacterium]|nr:hypothetical protein [Deltaproteobacteria bacterium]
MKRLIITALLMLVAAACFAAAPWYTVPNAKRLYDDSRIMVYTNASGTRNLTGLQLKQDLNAFIRLSSSKRVADATQIFNLMTTGTSNKLVKRAAPGATTYTRLMEIKDNTGKIVYWINNSGQMVFGTPVALAVSTVYPTNGATNVSNGTWFNYSSTGLGWQRINTTTPAVTYNKQTGVTISEQYIVGSAITPAGSEAVWSFNNFSGAAGTTYTMKVSRAAIVQTDGETANSCGTAMTDIAGLCTSTFTMK